MIILYYETVFFSRALENMKKIENFKLINFHKNMKSLDNYKKKSQLKK